MRLAYGYKTWVELKPAAVTALLGYWCGWISKNMKHLGNTDEKMSASNITRF